MPLPKHERDFDFPMCGSCAAQFYLTSGKSSIPQGHGVGVLHAPSTREMSGEPCHGQAEPALVKALGELAHLHSVGALDTDEFRAAKRRLLMSPV